MRSYKLIMIAAFCLIVQSCGNMGNNVNEDHSNYSENPGMNDETNPNTSTAPVRDVYDTDSMTSTSGPDNAAPKSDGIDSAQRRETR